MSVHTRNFQEFSSVEHILPLSVIICPILILESLEPLSWPLGGIMVMTDM